MMERVKILLVDDHKIIREGLKALLLRHKHLEIVAECGDGSETISMLGSHNIDIILMDISMKQMNGIEATKLVKEKFPKVKILIVTMHQQEGYINSLKDSGADGFVLKSAGECELVRMIELVMSGRSGFCFGAEKLIA